MGLSAACIMGVAGCSSNNQNSGSGAVAATINGTEIYEDTVTDYIQSVREHTTTRLPLKVTPASSRNLTHPSPSVLKPIS